MVSRILRCKPDFGSAGAELAPDDEDFSPVSAGRLNKIQMADRARLALRKDFLQHLRSLEASAYKAFE
jgi:hypothetical protein